MTTTLLIPVLNEIDGLRVTMPLINRGWVDQILFVDGGSTDGSLEYIKENGYEYVEQKKKGMRFAYYEALPYVKGEVIITFSPDGNSVPACILTCLEYLTLTKADMVIVSRYLDWARSYDDDILTGFGNRVFTFLINLLHGGKYTDAMVIFRAYRKSLISELDLDKDTAFSLPERIFNTRVSFEPLLSIRAARKKKKVYEIPGSEPRRIGGKRKLQVFKWGAVFLWQTIAEIFS